MNDRTAVMRTQPNSLTITWLALGLTLTLASQLRIALYLPIGPGEILCALWIGWIVISHLIINKAAVSRQAVITVIIGAVALIILLAGMLSSVLLNLWEQTGWRDFFALVFVIALTFAFNLYFTDHERIERFCLTLMIFLALYVFPLLLISRFTVYLGPFSLYYKPDTNPRFAALATRPGQLDFIFVALPFLALYFFFRKDGLLTKITLVLLALATVFMGLDHSSDAFLLSLATGVLIVLFMIWLKSVSKLLGRNKPAGLTVIIFSFVIACGISLLLVSGVMSWAEQLYNAEEGQGSVRIALWLNGLKAASASPFVGLGPGVYSGISAPFLGAEAHNTFIDVAASGGILGGALFLGLIVCLAWRCWKTGFVWLNAAFMSVLAYSFFHYTLRQPLFLISLIMVSNLAVMAYQLKQEKIASVQKYVD